MEGGLSSPGRIFPVKSDSSCKVSPSFGKLYGNAGKLEEFFFFSMGGLPEWQKDFLIAVLFLCRKNDFFHSLFSGFLKNSLIKKLPENAAADGVFPFPEREKEYF